jgi:hypothetical protein
MVDDNPKAGSSSARLQIVLALITVLGAVTAAFIARVGSGTSGYTINNNLPQSPPAQATPAPPSENEINNDSILQCIPKPSRGKKEVELTANDRQDALGIMIVHGDIHCVKRLLDYGVSINGAIPRTPGL